VGIDIILSLDQRSNLTVSERRTATLPMTTNLLLPLTKGGWEGLRSIRTKSPEYATLLPGYNTEPLRPDHTTISLSNHNRRATRP
jgi:hypothetical protein